MTLVAEMETEDKPMLSIPYTYNGKQQRSAIDHGFGEYLDMHLPLGR